MRTCNSCIWSVATENGDMYCEYHGIYIHDNEEPCVHYGPFNLEDYYTEENNNEN